MLEDYNLNDKIFALLEEDKTREEI